MFIVTKLIIERNRRWKEIEHQRSVCVLLWLLYSARCF